MAEHIWSITDRATTGARWSMIINVDDDGRGCTISRDPTWTDLSNVQTGSIAVEFTSRADNGASVSQGATWADLSRPVRFDWDSYRQEVDLRLYGRTTGAFARSAGIPAGQPQSVAGGTEAASFEVGFGTLRPLAAAQTDWRVEDRPPDQPATPALRYTTIEAVKGLLKAPAGREAAVWQSGGYDDRIAQCVRAAEQRIDSYCGRRFDIAAAGSSSRTYRRSTADTVPTHDFVGTPTVSIGDSVIPASMYSRQIVSESHRDVYRGLRLLAPNVTPDQMHGFDLDLDPGYPDVGWSRGSLPAVAVSARWGWTEVPDDIAYVAGLIAQRLFRRPDEAAFGVMTTGGMPSWISRSDPDVEALLAPYSALTRPNEIT